MSLPTYVRVQVNKVAFAVSGLGMIKGALTITASFEAVSEKRVAITFQHAILVRHKGSTLPLLVVVAAFQMLVQPRTACLD